VRTGARTIPRSHTLLPQQPDLFGEVVLRATAAPKTAEPA
jgi:hypothetical protein